jgi:hypothetical protein
MGTNSSQTSKVTYTGGVRSKGGTGPVKRFDKPKDAYNDLYTDVHKKLNGGSSWVKPNLPIVQYIEKFAPKEDSNDPKSYTNTMVSYFNQKLKENNSTFKVGKDTTLGTIKKELIAANLDPEHEFTKAHLKVEDPKVLRDLNKPAPIIPVIKQEPPRTTKEIIKNINVPKNNETETTKSAVEITTDKVVDYVKKPLGSILVKAADLIKKIESSPINGEQPTKSELKELLTSDISLGQKVNTIVNGIQKNLIQEPIANIESWYDEHFSNDKTVYPDASVSKIKKAAAIEKIKSAKDQIYKIEKQNQVKKYFEELPAITKNDNYNLDKLTFGSRNKKDNSEVSTKGVILQTLNPIVDNISKLQPFQLKQQLIALDKKSGKISFPDSIEKLPKNSVFTTANKFVVTDFDASQKTKDTKNGTGTWFPTLITKEGEKLPYAVGASMSDNTRNEGLYGGKMLLISEDGKHKQLFFGSVAKLQKNFYTFKQKTNSNEVSLIQLDQGSYNRIVTPNNGKMTKKDWENYDAKNVSGGHAFYITN